LSPSEVDKETRNCAACRSSWVKLHRQVIERGRKVLVILEGRDPPEGRHHKRIAAHLSPREVRIVAPASQ